MKILSIHLQNFSSYKKLDYTYESGLTLVQGPTGSGKSTLCDAIPWILFGKTAKGGAVDEVRSWSVEGPTTGAIMVEFSDKSVGTVFRVRGKQNDLYYSTLGAPEVRGKDLNDTQKLINNLLGMDYELYLSGAYFHEFSQSAQFFITTAKNRRSICEQIVDLSLAKKLQTSVKDKTKILNEEGLGIQGKIQTLDSNISLIKRMQAEEGTKYEKWQASRSARFQTAAARYDEFEASRKKTVSNQCKSCGTILAEPKVIIDKSENPWREVMNQIDGEVNPHKGSVKDYSHELVNKYQDLDNLKALLQVTRENLTDLEILSDVTDTFRSRLIQDTISYIEDNTNRMISDYFDSEIRVSFTSSDNDKLEVEIYKDGNSCVYTQLSKGQRQLLKLTFGLSVMKAVGNHHGIRFNQIFLDEALDGLDENLKIKAYRLLQSLSTEYESVFVVEHSSALKELFDSKITVELVSGESQLCQS